MTRRVILKIVLPIAIGLFGLGSSPASGAAARSVESFNSLKPNWGKSVGVRMKVEGRYSSISRDRLRFRHCDLPFRSKNGKPFPRLLGKSKTIEVVGQIGKQDGKLVFLVDRLRPLASDMERFRIERGGLRSDKPDQWYTLAEWATHRSAFYDDQELAKQAEAAYLKGIAIERSLLSADDAEGLFLLAAKAATFQLADSLRMELVHQGYQLLWKVSETSKQPKLHELTEKIRRDLPGSDVALQAPQPKLRQKYLDDPLAVYEEADEARRRKLHRMFYSQIVLAMILKGVRKDGSNGFAIAEQIDKLLPEQHALAETYRDQELAFKLTRIGTNTREEALLLSSQFRRRNQAAKAREVLVAWLEAKVRRVRQVGPAALVPLAEEYINLLEDEQTAANLLKEAYQQSKQSPASQEIAARLKRLGYRLQNGRWLSKPEAQAAPPDPVRQAMREGRVTLGMTPDEVRKTLGLPTSVIRIATAGQINEVWTYGRRGASRLAVHFLRRSRQSRAESKAVKVLQTQP